MKYSLFSLWEWSKRQVQHQDHFTFFAPVIEATENFFFQNRSATSAPPHIRDAVNVKRWMFLVLYALLPCIAMAIWNTGMQKFVYSSGDEQLVQEFMNSCHRLADYWRFAAKESRYLVILRMGLGAFLPVMLVSYAVGGIVEALFACIRRKPIEEGLLVSAMLFALILPPTIPLWMVAFGVATGIVFGKELFGGTGMNIVNPALCCRIILFFSFPLQMTGDIWVGTNPAQIKESFRSINRSRSAVDAYTQATPLARYNIPKEIRRIDIEAIALQFPHMGDRLGSSTMVSSLFHKYAAHNGIRQPLGNLSWPVIQGFVTAAPDQGGLGLSYEGFIKAKQFAELEYSQGILTNWNLFLGNRMGSMGETSVFASLLGALLLVGTGVGSLRTMVCVLMGAMATAGACNLISYYLLAEHGAFANAALSFPWYKHLLIGGLAFGAVFMATDPVSSPTLPKAKILYGLLIGFLTIIIRTFNPAYPEGVMLAIFFANITAPMLDHIVASFERRGKYVAS